MGLFVSNTGRPVKGMNGVYTREYVNVAQAGVREVMYVFRNPQQDISNSFECTTRNRANTKSASFEFKIQVDNK